MFVLLMLIATLPGPVTSSTHSLFASPLAATRSVPDLHASGFKHRGRSGFGLRAIDRATPLFRSALRHSLLSESPTKVSSPDSELSSSVSIEFGDCESRMETLALANPLILGMCRDDTFADYSELIVRFCTETSVSAVVAWIDAGLTVSDIRPDNIEYLQLRLRGEDELVHRLIDTARRCAIAKYMIYNEGAVDAAKVATLQDMWVIDHHNPIVTWDDTRIELDVLVGRARTDELIDERARAIFKRRLDGCPPPAPVGSHAFPPCMISIVNEAMWIMCRSDPGRVGRGDALFVLGKARADALPLITALVAYSAMEGAVVEEDFYISARTTSLINMHRDRAAMHIWAIASEGGNHPFLTLYYMDDIMEILGHDDGWAVLEPYMADAVSQISEILGQRVAESLEARGPEAVARDMPRRVGRHIEKFITIREPIPAILEFIFGPTSGPLIAQGNIAEIQRWFPRLVPPSHAVINTIQDHL